MLVNKDYVDAVSVVWSSQAPISTRGRHAIRQEHLGTRVNTSMTSNAGKHSYKMKHRCRSKRDERQDTNKRDRELSGAATVTMA